ncbi:hypothetical protein [Paenirhodobacter populi]|uniref:hypothetical protein n=1 Tax=Paenirhodobacter populi TaxID=2306993 RepID=UPI0019D44DB9|nr:hypothetical protein [Sinirhodobacter populi]
MQKLQDDCAVYVQNISPIWEVLTGPVAVRQPFPTANSGQGLASSERRLCQHQPDNCQHSSKGWKAKGEAMGVLADFEYARNCYHARKDRNLAGTRVGTTLPNRRLAGMIAVPTISGQARQSGTRTVNE